MQSDEKIKALSTPLDETRRLMDKAERMEKDAAVLKVTANGLVGPLVCPFPICPPLYVWGCGGHGRGWRRVVKVLSGMSYDVIQT